MGMGLSLAMESDIGASFAGLVYRELQDGSGPNRGRLHAHWGDDDNENPALKRFLDLLAERYPSPARSGKTIQFTLALPENHSP